MIWLKFMSDAARGDGDAITRYRRINPNLREDPPQLDDIKNLPHLRRRMHQIIKRADFQKQIGQIARQLVASSFYIDCPYIPTSPSQDLKTFVYGMISQFCDETKLIREVEIQCKFSSASQDIRRLGKYLMNLTTRNFQPYFVIGEKSSTSEPIKIKIAQPLIDRMMMNASFEVDPVLIPISNESAITTICLSMVDGEELSISGLPRALLAKKAVKGNCASVNINRYQLLIVLIWKHCLQSPTNRREKRHLGITQKLQVIESAPIQATRQTQSFQSFNNFQGRRSCQFGISFESKCQPLKW